MKIIQENTYVQCILVTGEKGAGIYDCQSPTTGSYLIRDFVGEKGVRAEFVWADQIS